MWKVISSKMFWLYAVAVFAVLAIFSFAQIGARNSVELKQLPVAVVNASGDQQSKKIVSQLKDKFSDSDAQLKLINVKKESSLKQGFTDKKYYGALVIDKDFDKSLTSQQNYLKGLVIQSKTKDMPEQAIAANDQLKAQVQAAKSMTQTLPSQAKIRVIANQGMNSQASSVVTTALPKISNALSDGMSQKMQGALKENNVTLSTAQWQVINDPIKVSTQIKNKLPNKSVSGMAPMLLVVLSWLSSLIASILLWREHKKHAENGRFSLSTINSQMITGIVMSVVASLTIYFFAHTLFDVPVPDTGSFLLLLMFNIFIFYLLQTCILNWAGFAGWPILILIMLLSMGVVSYPKEMLSPFFLNGIYSWTLLRFAIDLFTNNLYISGSSATSATDYIVLSSICVVALVLIYLSSLLKRKEK